MSKDPKRDRLPSSNVAFRSVCLSGVVLLGIFFLINLLSKDFEYGAEPGNLILLVVGLLVTAGPVAFFGLAYALKVPIAHCNTLWLIVFSFAISLRLVAIFTCPILEIDYYRYLWDGKVSAEAISPYRYSPSQVLIPNITGEESLDRLKTLSIKTECNYTILSRIHFADHTTIYPPVSQLVFAAVMAWLPRSASIEAHIMAIKLALVVFDIGTLFLIFVLLNHLQLHPGWSMIYAWNPLVIKEIANGGHLDSIATFLLMLAIFLLVRWRIHIEATAKTSLLFGSAFALGLAVGAKLFPLLLFPVLGFFVGRKSRIQAGLYLLIAGIVSAVSLLPMLYPILDNKANVQNSITLHEPQEQGVVSFFSRWRMNDTLFSFVYLNLKDGGREPEKTPWYVVTPVQFRAKFRLWVRSNLGEIANPAFVAARLFTLIFFGVVYLLQLARYLKCTVESQSARTECLYLLNGIAMLMFVFLLMQPTVNPWYFVWFLPMSCFTSNQGWLICSGLAMIYYFRFWFELSSKSMSLGGRNYVGVEIYDHIVVWIATILALGAVLLFRRRGGQELNHKI